MLDSIPFPGQPVRGSATGRPIMALLDLLSRAWGLGVIWQLNDGPYSFRQLQSACDNISPTVLNRRLKELRTTGLVDHDSEGYYLTTLGQELFRLLEPMGTWSKTWATEITAQPEA